MKEQTQQLPSLDVQCQITPAKIVANIDALREALTKQITEQSATVITVDNVKEGKELAAKMNKVAKAIDAARIQAVKDATVDIALFETAMKELAKMATDGSEKIKVQNDVFEKAKLKQIEQILADALVAEFDRVNVPAEFRKANINGLVLLGSVTAKDALTTKTKSELSNRVGADKALSDQTDKRLLMLENTCLKAGMISSLTRAHVETFLFADDATYQARLDALIASELDRQRATEQRLREQQAAEQRRIDEQNQRAAAAAQQRALDEQAAKLCAEHAASVPAADPQQIYNQAAAIQQAYQQPVQEAAAQQSYQAPQRQADNTVDSQKDKFATLVDGKQVGIAVLTTRGEFEKSVVAMSAEQPGYFEVWCKAGGLVSIAKGGELFHKVEQQ